MKEWSWYTRVGLALLLIITSLVVAAPAAAQDGESPRSVRLITPYLGVAAEPGDTTSLTLDVAGPPGEVVDLEVTGVPEGWDAHIRGGGFVVDRVMVDEATDLDLRLEIDVPPTAAEGTYELGVVAQGSSSTDRLDVALLVAQAVGGGVSLNAEFPALRGPSDVEFSFSLELLNETGEELQFGLQAQGPDGWLISAGPAGQSRASSVTVDASGSQRVSVDVDPPDFTPTGVYPVLVQAAGGGETVSAELLVEITGNFAVALTTPDERLNFDVVAGDSTEVPLLVVNQGTAPLTEVTLSGTPPRGWDVSFSPQSIDRIEPGGSAEVTAVVTPSSDAIAGDYRITMQAGVAETTDSVEMRVTVETSALWGLIGVGVILVALAGLGLVFRRFGRR